MTLLTFKHLTDFNSSEGYWSSTDCILIAADILSISKAKSMLEIGFNIGYSAAVWLDQGIETLAIIDIGKHKDTLDAIHATANFYNNKNIMWWIGNSLSEDAKNLELPELDIVFIDGEHSYAAAKSDSELAKQYGANWIVYDDVIPEHINGIHNCILDLESSGFLEVIRTYKMSWTEQGEVYLCKIK